MSALYFEEYSQDWGYETESKLITDEDINTFVHLHGFLTPTFTNSAYMHGMKDYGGRMAPGLMILCMAEGLVLNAGVTRRRGIFLMELTPKFKKPVFAGESIFNRVRFKSKRLSSKPDRGVVVTHHEVVTNKGDIAIEYDSTRMIRTRLFVEPPEQAA